MIIEIGALPIFDNRAEYCDEFNSDFSQVLLLYKVALFSRKHIFSFSRITRNDTLGPCRLYLRKYKVILYRQRVIVMPYELSGFVFTTPVVKKFCGLPIQGYL